MKPHQPSQMPKERYLEKNQKAWEQVRDYHNCGRWEAIAENFRDRSYIAFNAWEREVLRLGDIRGKRLIHPCCNNGVETISLAKLGADCLGVDFSGKFIEDAKALAAISGCPVAFLNENVLEIDEQYENSFDFVFISVGTLGWIRDLNKLFYVCSKVLKPGGMIKMLEMHPMLNLFEPGDASGEIVHSYFKEEPFIDMEGIDYYGGEQYASEETYWFHHRLDEIFRGLLSNAFSINRFEEFQKEISKSFAQFEEKEVVPPLSFYLEATLAP